MLESRSGETSLQEVVCGRLLSAVSPCILSEKATAGVSSSGAEMPDSSGFTAMWSIDNDMIIYHLLEREITPELLDNTCPIAILRSQPDSKIDFSKVAIRGDQISASHGYIASNC